MDRRNRWLRLHGGKNGAMVLLFSFFILILLEMNLSQIFTFCLPL